MILFRSVVGFFRDDGPMLSGAISCFVMLAVVPFLLLLVSIFGYLLGHDSELYLYFLSQLSSLFPSVTHQITNELESIAGFRTIAIPNLLVYAFFSYQLYVSLENAVQHVFRVKSKRPLGYSILLSFVMITLLAAFTIISFGATWVISLLGPLQKFFPDLEVGAATRFLSRFVLPILLVFLMATALYILLPRRRVRLFHALWGGLFTGLFFEAAKHVFTFFITFKIARLGTVYGSLTAIVTFLTWLFYSSSIFLIGAELVRNLAEAGREGGQSTG